MWIWIFGTLAVAAALIAIVGYFLFMRFRAPGGRTGRIEGVLLIDGKPAPPGTPVACSLSRECSSSPRWLSFITGVPREDVGQSFIMWSEYTMTEDEGKFAFERIPEGKANLGRAHGGLLRKSWLFGLVNISLESKIEADQERTVSVRANETTYVTLGVAATILRGRFVDPRDTGRTFNSVNSHCAFLSSKAELPEIPDDVPPEERDAWWKEFQASEEGLRWLERLQRMYHIAVDEQGHFSASNVQPGRYKLCAQLDHAPGGGTARPFGEYEGIVEVPSSDNGDAPVELDLGDLPLLLHFPLKPGEPLPAIPVRNHKGDPLEIPSGKDGYLLLCLWWPHDDIHGVVPKILKALEKSRARRNNIPEVFVITMDGQWAPAHHQLRGKKPDWPLKFVSEEDSLRLATTFGVRSSAFFLFSPEGTLIEGEIAPEGLKSSLRRAQYARAM
ncbi:MAG: hypothetical protein KF886_18145 [Candidatus Hydrogenedentes bacterium]|nr:hypothetical protein [Candidatus Hydrogenedentota bacterium]